MSLERSKCAAVAELSAEKALISLMAGYLHGQAVDKDVYRDIGVPALFALSKRWSMDLSLAGHRAPGVGHIRCGLGGGRARGWGSTAA